MPVFFASVLAPLYFGFPAYVMAAVPNITSFDVSPDSGSSGYPFSLLWILQDAGGSSLIVPCIDGVKARNANTGSDLACNTKISSTAAASDALLLKLINITGTSKTISIKLIPKDTSGVDQDAYAKFVSATISPANPVVASFTTSTTTTQTGAAVTLSWDTPEAAGANLSMECKDGIKATSPGYTSGNLPCGKHIFDTALGKTSSLAINFTNSSVDAVPIAFTLYPAIGTNIYNGINTAKLNVNVASDVTPDPIVHYFKTTSTFIVLSGENINLSWGTENAKGVNMKISCTNSITATSSVNLPVNLLCDKYAFTEFLAPTGTVSLAFQNQSIVSNNVTVALIPAFKNKDGYDATKSRNLIFEVRPASFIVAAPPAPPPPPTILPIPLLTPATPPAPSSISPPPATPMIKTTPKTTTPIPPPAPTVQSGPTNKPRQQTIPKLPGTLKTLINPGIKYDETREAEKSAEIKNRQEISSELLDKKQIDEIETIVLNSAEKIYDVYGRRRGMLFYIIPIKLKVSLTVDALSGNVKTTGFPWWSFLVKLK